MGCKKEDRKGERHRGADSLKILAAIFVVILHVNGYLSNAVPLEVFSYSSSIAWHSMEAVAYPAIHIFVMVSAYFLVDAKNPMKGGINVWIQTILVSLTGLLLAAIFQVPFGGKEAIRSIFPFLGRAYWYVSDYILLLFLAPILNRAIHGIERSLMRYIVVVLFGLNSVLSTFFAFLDWNQDYSNIGLFILLYFIVAYLKMDKDALSKIRGGILWGASAACLVMSWLVLDMLSRKGISIAAGREMFLYQYCSPLVIMEAVGIFICFFAKEMYCKSRLLKTLSSASLTVYLIHMHPVFKEHYVEWGILRWINVANPISYITQMAIVVGAVFMAGAVVSIPITGLSAKAANIIRNNFSNKFWGKNNV